MPATETATICDPEDGSHQSSTHTTGPLYSSSAAAELESSHYSSAFYIRHVLSRLMAFNYRSVLTAEFLFGWDTSAPTRSSATTWMDGLRGVAAVQVFFFHFFGRHALWGHTYGGTPESKYLHQTIFIRPIWCGGSGAVSTFFVISGYAITFKTLNLMRRKDYEGIHKSLASSVFRRGFRLWLPVAMLGIVMAFFIRFVDMTDGYVYPDELMPTWWQQIGHYITASDNHMNPFEYKDNSPQRLNRYGYVPTSWTIPMEYHGSIVCYVMILFISRINSFKTRAIILAATSTYALHQACWWASNFLVGVLIADWTIERKTRATIVPRPADEKRSRWHIAFYIGVTLFGIYLSGMPPQMVLYDFTSGPHVGYEWLYALYPPKWMFHLIETARWWWLWSGNLTFLGISQVPSLRAIFDTRFCQWLGKLSFALYLSHAIVISLLELPLEAQIAQYTSHKGVICLYCFAVLTPIIVILSAQVERFIDRPSVKFAKWLEGKAFAEDDTTLHIKTERDASKLLYSS